MAKEQDHRILRVTIRVLNVVNGLIKLAEYDPKWNEVFAKGAKRIAPVLGTKAVKIEHIGSTSVPELVAKPIIDILLLVPNSADEPSYAPNWKL